MMSFEEAPDATQTGAAARYGGFGRLVLVCLAGLGLAAFCLAGPAVARPIKLVAFGDSLTAGFNLPNAEGFAPKLEAALRAQGHDVDVVNGGVSGDTTTGGLTRLEWTLGDGTDAVILELGANDMLRGMDPKVPYQNLSRMLDILKAKHIKVLLTGMRATPSMGKDYAAKFDPIFAEIAKKYDVAFYPFFLEGIMGDPSRHLPDGIHPNARGVDTIVAKILPDVDTLLRSVESKS